ncbi:uncharacterized protein LOC143178288 [Calliopsis andreniformis]|uniref:uncharacterized protein LOC143178288 n=1 Tax=Calliopsis andreniformis TaxID=337506 RepID=UPI003FCDEF6B
METQVFLDQNYGHERNDSQVKKDVKDKDGEEYQPLSRNQHEKIFESSKNKESDEGKEELAIVKFTSKNEDDYDKNVTLSNLQQRFSKQVLQPYVLHKETKPVQDSASHESTNSLPRPARKSQNASYDTYIVEQLPSQEIIIQNQSTIYKNPTHENNPNDLGQVSSDDQVDIENVGDFGQRVRTTSPVRHRNDNLGRVKSRQPLDSLLSLEDYRKQYRKNFRPFALKKLNVSENTRNVFSEDRHASSPLRTGGLQKNESEEQNPRAISENIAVTKEPLPSTTTSTLTVSLGKFSGPIVVPDLPRQKEYSYTTVNDHSSNNEISKSTPASVESTTKSKGLDSGYLAASSIVLNPLQVGVALMNAEQDINLVNDPVVLSKDHFQNEVRPSDVDISNNESIVQSDDSLNIQNDQISQQEQISEVVDSNSPTQSVEIQKSVEIFHAAPVQEIHYPIEFVPHTQKSILKQHPSENDFKKLQKDRRYGHINIYKSNEIVDEIAPSNSQERERYEYNANENDVVYSATNGQVDQARVTVHPLDKTIFNFKEQPDNSQYDQTLNKYSRIQENPNTLKEVIKQSDFESVKVPPAVAAQPLRVTESLPGQLNPDNLQGSQEVPQILLTKTANDPQTELRLLMTVPQPYPVEKVIQKTVHIPHAIDVVEKKVPYPIEKVIEKQITIPQPFPVHVPIDRVVEKQIRVPYPIHVEKVIEKKIPFTIQRLIIPFPIHFRVPQPIPVPMEKVIEKPIPIPVPVPMEKVVEKVHISRPYSSDTTKLIKSLPVPIYNVPNDGNFQQIRQQNYQTSSGPSYGLASDDQSYYNSTQFYNLDHTILNHPPVRQPYAHVLPKKFGSYGVQYPHSFASYSTLVNHNGNSASYGKTSVEDNVKDEYVGPVPRKILQGSLGTQSKLLQYTSPDIQATMRRTRQEGTLGNTGSFRQSKMEYGFKPPMVPSVQYDEQSASKVE